jgi:tripartite-type tricarboxylate transporter receptor subunit TctC
MTRFLLAVTLAAVAATAGAQRWPERPVRVVVPLAPGGSVDVIARMLATRLTERCGQQFIVDNRAGAGSTIGIGIVARASPDGYTLLMMSPAFAANVSLYKLTYDPIKDIVPIAMVAAGPMFLAVHPAVKANSLRDFIELARAQPNTLRYGSGGIGSSTHLASELLRQLTRTELIHVPYKGIGAAIADLLSGQIQFYIAPGVALMPHVGTGRLRLLGVTGEQRSADLPELPAIAEVVPGYSATFWYGLGAPAGTPRSIVTSLNQELASIVKQPDLIKRLQVDDLKPAHSTPDAFASRIAQDIATWGKVVRAGGIRLE